MTSPVTTRAMAASIVVGWSSVVPGASVFPSGAT